MNIRQSWPSGKLIGMVRYETPEASFILARTSDGYWRSENERFDWERVSDDLLDMTLRGASENEIMALSWLIQKGTEWEQPPQPWATAAV